MDKNTLSNYGWIVIAVLVLSVMIALATPFGQYIENGVRATTEGLFSTSQNAMNTAFGDLGVEVKDQEFEDGYTGVSNESNKPEAIEGSATFAEYMDDEGNVISEPTTITWEELQLPKNADKYGYDVSLITDTEIGENAFFASSITDIIIPSTVKTIGANAFDESLLKNIVLQEGLISIGSYAFWGTDIENIIIPDSVILIDYGAFYGSSLFEVKLGNGLTTIGNYAFGWCHNLSDIIIPSNVTSIGISAFEGLSLNVVLEDNSHFTIENGILYNKDKTTLIQAVNSERKEFVIPDSVTEIYKSAFECTKFTSIIIPGSVKQIESNTFSDCSYLENVIISNGVTSIDNMAFSDATLRSITIPSSVTKIGESVFYGTYLKDIIFGGTTEQWNEIDFGAGWNEDCSKITVTCTDGTIIIPANE